MEERYSTIKSRLVALRKQSGKAQSYIAECMGMSRSKYARKEAEGKFTPDELIMLGQIFFVSPSYFTAIIDKSTEAPQSWFENNNIKNITLKNDIDYITKLYNKTIKDQDTKIDEIINELSDEEKEILKKLLKKFNNE